MKIVIFQHLYGKLGEKMSIMGEKMSGGFLPQYVDRERKGKHK